jgi:hypothetical protein
MISNKTNSDLHLRNVGIKRTFDPETVDIWKENPAEDVDIWKENPAEDNLVPQEKTSYGELEPMMNWISW